MRIFAIWAKNNPWKARISIILLHFLMGFLAYYLSKELPESIYREDIFLYITIIVFLIVALIYPRSKESARSNSGRSFIFRKACDLAVATCSFCALLCFNGKYINTSNFSQQIHATSPTSNLANPKDPTAEQILASLKFRDKSTLTRKEKRILKHEFKKQIKIYAKQKILGKKEASNKTLYIILAIVGAVGVLYLVAALSCSLSCNGMEAASIIVLILGLVGVGLALYFIIRRISRGPRNKPKPENASQGN